MLLPKKFSSEHHAVHTKVTKVDLRLGLMAGVHECHPVVSTGILDKALVSCYVYTLLKTKLLTRKWTLTGTPLSLRDLK